MSDSVQPHRRQPTRLPRPWDSPGKNTGVGCHFLLQCMKVKRESEVAQSCLTLSDPMDCSLPGSSVHGFSRQEYWSGVPLPFLVLDARNPKIKVWSGLHFFWRFQGRTHSLTFSCYLRSPAFLDSVAPSIFKATNGTSSNFFVTLSLL